MLEMDAGGTAWPASGARGNRAGSPTLTPAPERGTGSAPGTRGRSMPGIDTGAGARDSQRSEWSAPGTRGRSSRYPKLTLAPGAGQPTFGVVGSWSPEEPNTCSKLIPAVSKLCSFDRSGGRRAAGKLKGVSGSPSSRVMQEGSCIILRSTDCGRLMPYTILWWRSTASTLSLLVPRSGRNPPGVSEELSSRRPPCVL